MRIAIIQSCYIPWRGFFNLIGRGDEYVIYDRAQFVKRHWHNCNSIKTAAGPGWLTIPIISKGRHEQSLDEVEIAEPWAENIGENRTYLLPRAILLRARAGCARWVRPGS